MQDGGLADKLSLENPFDPNSKPINLKFNAERPYFNLPQAGTLCLVIMPFSQRLIPCGHPVVICPVAEQKHRV